MLLYLLAALGLVPTFQKAKCKKLLSISMERIKVLEKRRQARARQLQRDVIEILQLKKKEHKINPLLLRIWKELCLFSVYVKIAEYIGFVQMSLRDIAAQRECPSGLEEPLAGLCFAASCCAELPELQELREIFAMKYGKQISSSGQDLRPNCHVNQQFLDSLYANDPAEACKQALLEEIITMHTAMQSYEQETQPHELCDPLSTKGSVDVNDCNGWQDGSDFTMEVTEVEQSEYNMDVAPEPHHVEMVCQEEDLSSLELGNEHVIDRKICCSALKRAYARRKFWLNKAMEGKEKGGKECKQITDGAHKFGTRVCGDAGKWGAVNSGYKCSGGEDLRIVRYMKQHPYAQPPQRPPPLIPPPKRAPPSPPPSLRTLSMPRSCNDKEVNANTSVHRRCSTMTNGYYLENYGSHVHPRLPKYEDIYANFTALKG